MARSIWNGSLSFGLVSVPVELFSATEDKTIHFNQFQAGTSDRVRNKRVNERTGDEVEFGDIVKGYDLGGGEYVLVTPEELEAVEPGRTRNIEITDFVGLDDIDPVYYQKSYYLAPKGEQAIRAYGLLRKAMEQSKKVAVATLVMRGKQYLVAVRPEQRALVLETMHFADEVRDPTKEVPGLPMDEEFTAREVDTAKLLIDSMTVPWEPGRYGDTYRQRVEELIERKRRGEEVVVEAQRAEPTKVADLMAALQASVDAARGRQDSSKRAPRPAKAAAPAHDDLGALSKAELYDRAAALELPGRSKMTRQQLEEALESASVARSRKAS
ncbi:MAG TPA: Ku protein [Acidimicrobiales bacterium]|nr:Ku protein [Acidimicrobiales bacterium]